MASRPVEAVTVSVGIALRNFSLLTGVSRAVGELARRLPALGFDPVVLAHKKPSEPLPGVRFEKSPMLKFSSLARAATFDWWARRRLARLGVGLVHGQGDLTRQDVLTVHNCDAAAARHVPDGRVPSAGVRYVRGRQFSASRAVLAVSEMVRRDAIEFYGVAPGLIRTVYLGVDLDRFHPSRREAARRDLLSRAEWGEDVLVLLSVLSGDPAKRNFPLMARAVEAFSARRPVGFCVLGNSSWEKDPVARRLREKGLLFPVPPCLNVNDYFAAADAFLLPAHYEEFGLTALESLASGTPVILSRRCGAAELVSPGVNGLVFNDLNDPEELLSCLGQASAGAFDRAACRRSAEPFTWDRHAREVSAVYRALTTG